MSDLTPTQRRVAELVGAGASYKEIGYSLGIQKTTARAHVNAIAAKLPDDEITAYRLVMIWIIRQAIERKKAS